LINFLNVKVFRNFGSCGTRPPKADSLKQSSLSRLAGQPKLLKLLY